MNYDMIFFWWNKKIWKILKNRSCEHKHKIPWYPLSLFLSLSLPLSLPPSPSLSLPVEIQLLRIQLHSSRKWVGTDCQGWTCFWYLMVVICKGMSLPHSYDHSIAQWMLDIVDRLSCCEFQLRIFDFIRFQLFMEFMDKVWFSQHNHPPEVVHPPYGSHFAFTIDECDPSLKNRAHYNSFAMEHIHSIM